MKGYRLLEHTADMGIEASGNSLEELFLQSAYGLKEVLFGDMKTSPKEEIHIEIDGFEREELLVNWLNEILYLFEIKGIIPTEFKIEELSDNSLKAAIMGEPFNPRIHFVERAVKAATYHGLEIEKTNDSWRVRIYVDL